MKVIIADKKMADAIRSEEIETIIVDGFFLRVPPARNKASVFFDGEFHPIFAMAVNQEGECKLVVIAENEDQLEGDCA